MHRMPFRFLKVSGLLFGSFMVLFCSACSTSSDKKNNPDGTPWKIPPNSYFLSRIPPPPANDSASTKRDLKVILELQAKSTPARIARAEETYQLTVFTFGQALDPNFTPTRYPETTRFFKQINDLVQDINLDLKNTFKRAHPFQIDPQVKQIIVAAPGYSYPSYHAARCEVFRHVLDRLDPENKAGFRHAAHDVNKDRIFGGEHFPSDIEAGTHLGKMIFAKLDKDNAFRNGITHLKAEEWTPPPHIAYLAARE